MSAIDFRTFRPWALILLIVTVYAGLHSRDISDFENDSSSADYLYFSQMLKHPERFQNCIPMEMAKKIEPISFPVQLSMRMGEWGVSSRVQYLLFFIFQTTCVVTGIFLVVSSLGGTQASAVVAALLLLSSSFTGYGRYLSLKFVPVMVTSCLGLGVGFLGIGLFMTNRFLRSSLVGGALFYFHPTHALVLNGLLHGYWLYQWGVAKTLPFRQWLLLTGAACAVALSWAWTLHLHRQELFPKSPVDWGLWFDFLRARTSNPFPMLDGIGIVLCSLLFFVLLFWIYGIARKALENPNLSKARWVVCFVMALWGVQIFFTEILPSPFVAQLALTRATPYAVLFFVCLYSFLLMDVCRTRDRRGWGFLLLAAPLLLEGKTLLFPLKAVFLKFGIFPDIIFIFLLWTLYLHFQNPCWFPSWVSEVVSFGSRHLKITLTIIAVPLTVILILKTIKTGWGHVFNPRFLGKLWELGFIGSTGHLLILLLLLFCIKTSLGQKWAAWPGRYWSVVLAALALIGQGVSSEKERPPEQGIEMRRWIQDNTPQGSLILTLPFSKSMELSPFPLRPAYLDPAEMMYALYMPSMTSGILKRLQWIGLDFSEFKSKKTSIWRRYLGIQYDRRGFAKWLGQYHEDWRKNLASMRESIPNLDYVLLKKACLHPEDRPVFETLDYALIPVKQVSVNGKNADAPGTQELSLS